MINLQILYSMSQQTVILLCIYLNVSQGKLMLLLDLASHRNGPDIMWSVFIAREVPYRRMRCFGAREHTLDVLTRTLQWRLVSLIQFLARTVSRLKLVCLYRYL